MPYTTDFPEPEKHPSWDSLQKNLSPDDGLADIPGFTSDTLKKEAAYLGKELLQVEQDSLYANTGLLQEKLELETHIKRLMEEKQPYSIIEKQLRSMGYPANTIRRVFHETTGIDPIKAYLDSDNYPTPPGAVPRFCYGWGHAKNSKDADYFFVLPWIDKYGLFKLTGLERELVSEHWLVKDAREELKKHVKEQMEVTPDSTDILTDIIQKVAIFTRLSEKGAELYKELEILATQDLDITAKKVLESLDAGEITKSDFQIISEKIITAAPMSAPEKADEESFRDFRDDQEGRSFQEMKDNTVIPGQMFESAWGDAHKVNFFGLIAESKELFDELTSSIQGFKLEPSWGTFRVMPNPTFSSDDTSHVLDGSVAVGSTVQKIDGQNQTEIAILMFIRDGKLRYAGKFKGVNGREYAFTSIGLNEYFDDLEGSTALDEKLERGMPSDMGQMGGSGPSMQGYRG